jgi:hypothetical protein
MSGAGTLLIKTDKFAKQRAEFMKSRSISCNQ